VGGVEGCGVEAEVGEVGVRYEAEADGVGLQDKLRVGVVRIGLTCGVGQGGQLVPARGRVIA